MNAPVIIPAAPHNARPRCTDTPADLMLSMLGVLLEGGSPDLRDVVFLRTALL